MNAWNEIERWRSYGAPGRIRWLFLQRFGPAGTMTPRGCESDRREINVYCNVDIYMKKDHINRWMHWSKKYFNMMKRISFESRGGWVSTKRAAQSDGKRVGWHEGWLGGAGITVSHVRDAAFSFVSFLWASKEKEELMMRTDFTLWRLLLYEL